jgi:hypothetical protein
VAQAETNRTTKRLNSKNGFRYCISDDDREPVLH